MTMPRATSAWTARIVSTARSTPVPPGPARVRNRLPSPATPTARETCWVVVSPPLPTPAEAAGKERGGERGAGAHAAVREERGRQRGRGAPPLEGPLGDDESPDPQRRGGEQEHRPQRPPRRPALGQRQQDGDDRRGEQHGA